MKTTALARKRTATLLGSGLIGFTLFVAPAAGASVAELKGLAAKAPATAEDGLKLVVRLRGAGLTQEAMQVYYKSLAKAKDPALVAQLGLEKARIEIEKGRMKQAQAECEKLKKTAPVVHHICASEAYLLFRRGSLALPEAEKALDLKPDDYDATLAKGRALWISGNAEEAQPVLNGLVTSSPQRPEAYSHLAEVLIGIGKNTEAMSVLRRGLKVAKDDARLRVMLAGLLPPGDEAAQLLNDACELRVDYVDAYAALGALQLRLGKLDDAERSLKKALSFDTKNADTQAALAEVSLLRPDLDAALAQARAALKILPSNGHAKLIEAEALAAKGEIDLAIEEYQAAYGLQRRNPDVLVRAARACVAQGRPTMGMAFAERATSDFPESGAAFESLGDVLAASGDKKSARIAYTDALKKANPAPKDAIARKIAALK